MFKMWFFVFCKLSFLKDSSEFGVEAWVAFNDIKIMLLLKFLTTAFWKHKILSVEKGHNLILNNYLDSQERYPIRITDFNQIANH